MKRLTACVLVAIASAGCGATSTERTRETSSKTTHGTALPTTPPEADVDPVASAGRRDAPVGGDQPVAAGEGGLDDRSTTAPALGGARVVVGKGDLPDGTEWDLTAWQDQAKGLCLEFGTADPPTPPGSSSGGEGRGHGCGYETRIDQAQQIGQRHRFVYGPITPRSRTVIVTMSDGSETQAWLGSAGGHGFYVAEVSRQVPIRTITGLDASGSVVAVLERDQGEEAAILQAFEA